ncbi:MAG: TonB-dependent receptor plug domain-containing protein, partial [Roseateles sp.]
MSQLPIVIVQAGMDDGERRREAVQPMRAVGRDEIDKTNDLTLGEFLRRQAGVSYSGPPGNLKDIRLRGLDKGYTQILVDGEPWLSSTKERQVQVDQLPMSMVERIEIIRSPLADQAADGVAGAINVVLRRAQGRELTLRASAGAQDSRAGSQPQGGLQFTWAEGGQGDWAWVLPVNLTRRHELKTKTKQTETFNATTGARTALTGGSEVEDNAVTEWSLGPRLSWTPSASDVLVLNAFANLNRGEKHKTTLNDRAPDLSRPDQRITVNSTVEDEAKDRDSLMAGLRWQHRYTGGLQQVLGLSSQRGSEDKTKPKLDYNDKGVLTKTETEDATVRARSLRAYGELRWAATAAHDLGAGLGRGAEGPGGPQPTKAPPHTRPGALGALRGAPRAPPARGAGVPGGGAPPRDRKLKNGQQQTGLGDRFDIDEDNATVWLRHDWRPTAAHSLSWGLRHEERRTLSSDGA